MSDRASGSTLRRIGLACLLELALGFALSAFWVESARATNICSNLGAGAIPAGHIIINIVSAGSCTSGVQWQTQLMNETFDEGWACRPPTYPIPGGRIVTAVDTDRAACGAGAAAGTGWYVQSAGAITSSERMCGAIAANPIPPGYVVTQVDEDWNPCEGALLGFKIETPSPTAGTWACRSGSAAAWTLPTNYVITEIDNRSTCINGSLSLAWNIRIPTETNTLVCVPSPVPPGWVHVTDILSHAICAASGNGSYFRISPITDAQVTCTTTGIPSGFVIEDIKTSSVCGGPGYKVADLSVRSGETFACMINTRPPPPTHVVVETDNYSRCAVSGSAVGHKVALPSTTTDSWACRHAAAPIPSNFISFGIDTDFSRCGVGVAGGLADHIRVPVPGSSYTVCGNSPVPQGFFYTASGPRPQCNGGFGYDIGPVAPGAVACTPVQIPPEYVITSISGSGLCTGGNNYTVNLPATGGAVTNACTLSNTPPGFVWVGRMSTYSPCDAVFGLDYQMAEPDDTVGVKTNACSGSPIPPGFVYVEKLDLAGCEGSNNDAKISVPDPNGSTIVCNTANLPPGFVITEIDNYSPCQFTAGATIRFPNAIGTTIICSPSTPPPGFEVIATGAYAACGAGGADGPGATIRPVSQGTLPTPFINAEPDVPFTAPAELCPSAPANPPIVPPGGAPKNTAKCTW